MATAGASAWSGLDAEGEQESVARDRLQPVLLDRLTDKQPDRKSVV